MTSASPTSNHRIFDDVVAVQVIVVLLAFFQRGKSLLSRSASSSTALFNSGNPADLGTTAEHMFAQGKEMFSWIPNAYIKYPSTHEGLRAAQMSVQDRIRVNMTLCFSQEQAAAVYSATKGSVEPVYVSPFVGRLDDHGENGMDLVKNIEKMYESGDGHVHVLAPLRHLEHLLCAFALETQLVTVPARVLEEWAAKGFPMPNRDFAYKAVATNGKPLNPLPYRVLKLNQPWENFDIAHELTTKGIRKFVEDYQNTLRRTA